MRTGIARSMDGETAFGVGPYSEIRVEAVNGERLADRRVIALGINAGARETQCKGRGEADGGEDVDTRSLAAFMSVVGKSKNMARGFRIAVLTRVSTHTAPRETAKARLAGDDATGWDANMSSPPPAPP